MKIKGLIFFQKSFACLSFKTMPTKASLSPNVLLDKLQNIWQMILFELQNTAILQEMHLFTF